LDHGGGGGVFEAGYIRPKVRARIEELRRAGGRIVDGVPVTAATLDQAGVAPLVAETSCAIRWIVRTLEDGGKLFFLSNFEETGAFEASLRVDGLAPELFNPVTGEIRKLARYTEENDRTKIQIDVQDPADSYFVVFRHPSAGPSVVEASAPPSELALFFDDEGRLMAESRQAGRHVLGMSDGSQRTLHLPNDSRTIAIEGPWQIVAKEAQGHTVVQATSFDLPDDFSQGDRVSLHLGEVGAMARVTLNDHQFDTLWMPPFTYDVTDMLKPGENQLTIRSTSTTDEIPDLRAADLRTFTRKVVVQQADER